MAVIVDISWASAEVFLDDLGGYAIQRQVSGLVQELSIDDDFILVRFLGKTALSVVKVEICNLPKAHVGWGRWTNRLRL